MPAGISAASQTNSDADNRDVNNTRRITRSLITAEASKTSQFNGSTIQDRSAAASKKKPLRPPSRVSKRLKDLSEKVIQTTQGTENNISNGVQARNKQSNQMQPRYLASKIQVSKQSIAIKRSIVRKKINRSSAASVNMNQITMGRKKPGPKPEPRLTYAQFQNLMRMGKIDPIPGFRRKPGKASTNETLKLLLQENAPFSQNHVAIRRKPDPKPKNQFRSSVNNNAIASKERQRPVIKSLKTGTSFLRSNNFKMRQESGLRARSQMLQIENPKKGAHLNEVQNNLVPAQKANTSRSKTPRPKTPGNIKKNQKCFTFFVHGILNCLFILADYLMSISDEADDEVNAINSQVNSDGTDFALVSKLKRFILHEFSCNFCDYITRSFNDMQIHMNQFHPSEKLCCCASIKYISKTPYHKSLNLSKRFLCSNCPGSFRSAEYLRQHMEKDCCKKFVCVYTDCLFTNKDLSKVLIHIDEKHS